MQGESASPTQKKEGSSIFQGWKKFFAPPTMIEQEEKLETMDPTSRLSFDFVMNQLDILSRSTRDANMRAQYAYIKADMEIDRAKSKYAEDFVWDFIRWIEGVSSKNVVFEPVPPDPNGQFVNEIGIDDYPVITPWGNKPYTFLPDVKDFLDTIVDQKATVEKFIAKLKNRWPRNLPELWFWYKYIVHKQAIDGTVIEYAKSIEPYEFIPRDKLPRNPEDGSQTYPYYEPSEDPLHPQGPYKGPSFLVQQDYVYNPNPPRYQEVDRQFMQHIRGIMEDPETTTEEVFTQYRNIFKYNNWAFDRTDLENVATELNNLIDQVPDAERRAALRNSFGFGPTDAPNNIAPVDGLIIQQGIQDAFAHYLQNNPAINVNVNNAQAPAVNNQAIEQHVQALEQAVNNAQAQNQQGIQDLLAAIAVDNPVVAPQIDQVFVGRIEVLEQNLGNINQAIQQRMNTPFEAFDYGPIKDLTKAINGLKIPSQISYSGPLSLGVGNLPKLEVNQLNLPKISIDSSNVPKSIPVDVSNLPQNIPVDSAGLPQSIPISGVPDSIKVDTPGAVTVNINAKDIAREISQQLKLPAQKADIPMPPVKEIIRETVTTESMSSEQFETLKTNIVSAITDGFTSAGLKPSAPFQDEDVNNLKAEIADLKSDRDKLKFGYDGLLTAYNGVVTSLQAFQNLPKEKQEVVIQNIYDNKVLKDVMKQTVSEELKGTNDLVRQVIDENKNINAFLKAEDRAINKLSRSLGFLNTGLETQSLRHKEGLTSLSTSIDSLNAGIAAHLTATRDLSSQVVAGLTSKEEVAIPMELEAKPAVDKMGMMVDFMKSQGEQNRIAAEELRNMYNLFMKMMKDFYEEQRAARAPKPALGAGPGSLAEALRNGPDVEEIEEENTDIENPEYPPTNLALLGYYESEEQVENLPEEEKVAIANDAIDKATNIIEEAANDDIVAPNAIIPFKIAKLLMSNPESAKTMEKMAPINTFTAISDPKAAEDPGTQVNRVNAVVVRAVNETIKNPSVPQEQKNKIVNFIMTNGESVSGTYNGEPIEDFTFKPINMNAAKLNKPGYTNIYQATRAEGRSFRENTIEYSKSLDPGKNLTQEQLSQVGAGEPSVLFDELQIDPETAAKFVSALTQKYVELDQTAGKPTTIENVRNRVITILRKMAKTKRIEADMKRMEDMTRAAESEDALISFTRNYIDESGQLGEQPKEETMEAGLAQKYFSEDASNRPEFVKDRTEYFSFLKATDSLYMKFREVMDTLESCGLEKSKVYEQTKQKRQELEAIQKEAIKSAIHNFDHTRVLIDGWKRKSQYEFGGWNMAVDAAINPLIRELQGVSEESNLSEYHRASNEIMADLKDIQKMAGKTLLKTVGVNPGVAISARAKAAMGFKEKLKFVESDIKKAIQTRLENEVREQRRKDYLVSTLGPISDSVGKAMRASFPYDPDTDKYSMEEERDPSVPNRFNIKLKDSDFGDTLTDLHGANELYRMVTEYNRNAGKHSNEEIREFQDRIAGVLTQKAMQGKELPKFKDTYDPDEPSFEEKKEGLKRKRTPAEEMEKKYQEHLKRDPEGRAKMAKDYESKFSPWTKPLTDEQIMHFITTRNMYAGLRDEKQMEEYKKLGIKAFKPGTPNYEMVQRIKKGAEKNQFSNEYWHAWAFANPTQNAAKEFMDSINPNTKNKKPKKGKGGYKSGFKF